MSIRPRLKYFGTSGIRGRTLIDITPNFAERMARAYADVVLSGIDNPFIVIGRDTRYGAESLELALIAGLTASGVSVKRCGIVPTPVLITYEQFCNADGAIVVTGSHIAPNRIGLIFLESDGAYCSDFIAEQIEQRFNYFRENDGLISIQSVEDLNNIGKIEECKNVWEVYFDFLQSKVDIKTIQNYKHKIFLDLGNGTGALNFSKIFTKIGLKFQSINDNYQPLPNRPSEPIDKNLRSLKECLQSETDIGVAFDLDADRVTFVVYNQSEVKCLSADLMGAFFLNEFVTENITGKVVLPINSSYLAEIILSKINEKPVYCKIGQPGTIEAVKKVPDPLFSYEESGKFYFLFDGIIWTDGLLMVLKVLEVLSKQGKSLYALLEETFKEKISYETLTKKLVYESKEISSIKENVAKKLQEYKFPNESDREDLDGVRINFVDQSWLLFRASGTEPAYRIVANGKNHLIAEKILKLGEDFIKNI